MVYQSWKGLGNSRIILHPCVFLSIKTDLLLDVTIQIQFKLSIFRFSEQNL